MGAVNNVHEELIFISDLQDHAGKGQRYCKDGPHILIIHGINLLIQIAWIDRGNCGFSFKAGYQITSRSTASRA